MINQTSKTMIKGKSAEPENKDIYKILFENVHDGIYRSTPEGKIITANPALIKMLGYDSEEELKQLNISTDLYVNPADRDLFISRILEKGDLKDTELNLKRKDGSKITVLENSYPVYDSDGKISYFEGTLIDITSRKNAEEALRESENRYHTLVETIQDGLSLFDLQGKLSYFNRRKREMLGYENDAELMQVNTFDLIHPDDRGMAVELFEEILHKGYLRNKEIRILRKDGSWFWAELTANLITNSAGEPVYIMDTMRDITERRREDDEIRLRLLQLRQI
ncbi:MAG: PAS domain S-box protein, partial [Bacteroidales bacterium]|nr:PAS domain S-box protein [Bacteroidales bacterium]